MRIALTTAFLCLVASPAFAQEIAQSEIHSQAVRGNLSVLIGLGSNVVVSTGPDATLLVDDEYAVLNDKVRAALAALKAPPVKGVINTHWHEDHTGGNESFGLYREYQH